MEYSSNLNYCGFSLVTSKSTGVKSEIKYANGEITYFSQSDDTTKTGITIDQKNDKIVVCSPLSEAIKDLRELEYLIKNLYPQGAHEESISGQQVMPGLPQESSTQVMPDLARKIRMLTQTIGAIT